MTARWMFGVSMVIVLSTALIPDIAVWAETGASDPGGLRQELDEVKAELEAVKKQLSEMQKQLVQRLAPAAPAAPVTMSVGDGPALGSADAPVTVVEFSDYQCPYCKKHVINTLGTLKTDYIATGKVRYVFRDFPLDSIHPLARKAAEAAHCAGEQGKFWDMHDVMFHNQAALMQENLREYARDMKMDIDAFNACLDDGKYAKRVEEDVAAGAAAGVTGTPKFFIGKVRADGTMVATVVKGAQPAAVFSQVIDRLLEDKRP